MTQQEKDSLIGKMIGSPELLTRQETDAIVNDDDLCRIYRTAVILKAASQPEYTYDVDSEWLAMRQRLRPARRSKHFAARAAAIIVGVLFVSSLVLGLIYHFDSKDDDTIAAGRTDTLTIINAPPVIDTRQKIALTQPDVDMPKAQSKAQPKAKTMAKASRQLRSVKTDTVRYADPAEVQRQIDLIQARADNAVASQRAETYTADYSARQLIKCESPDLPIQRVDNKGDRQQNSNFMRVVMQ